MKKHLSLYHKFAIMLICAGLLPMGILCSAMVNKMFGEYRLSVSSNYSQVTSYMNLSLNDMIKNYDDTTKMMYYYDMEADQQTVLTYGNYDNIRQILLQEEENRIADMERFLQTVQSADGSITAVHFIAQDAVGEQQDFHYNTASNYFEDEQIFESVVGYANMSRTTRTAMMIPTHKNSYYHGADKQVFTIARNYFDLTRMKAGNTYDYLGTLFIDVDAKRLENVYEQTHLSGENEIYIIDSAGICFFSTDSASIGKKVESTIAEEQELSTSITMESDYNSYGLKTRVVMETDEVYSHIRYLQRMIYIILAVSLVVLAWGAIVFSKRLTKPIHSMMDKMAEIETGNFRVKIPVTSNDEIGVLSERFNQMSRELERYINQVYVAQVKQTEAEMTALRSQIYPHFLYNTLEVIRMTALEERDETVSRMIEALSVQIHYIIGTVQDMVPLGKEVEIVEKYIYLLNCRIDGEIAFHSDIKNESSFLVPKLILQPIVENAYVHGIKPKEGSGTIRIDTEESEKELIISVMDNGIGMSKEEVDRIMRLLEGNAIGIKNEHNWQSIGLKNVHDRVRYLYGKEYGLRISSSEMVGTIVSIVLPLNGKEDSE